jgi:hypothetical protein
MISGKEGKWSKKRRGPPSQSKRSHVGTHCTQEKLITGRHVYMLHKAYPALNLSRHLAHLTGTQKKPEKEPQTSPRVMEHTTKLKKPLQFLSPLLLASLQHRNKQDS